jgi:hypothetical protein
MNVFILFKTFSQPVDLKPLEIIPNNMAQASGISWCYDTKSWNTPYEPLKIGNFAVNEIFSSNFDLYSYLEETVAAPV